MKRAFFFSSTHNPLFHQTTQCRMWPIHWWADLVSHVANTMVARFSIACSQYNGGQTQYRMWPIQWWPDWQLARKETGFTTQCEHLCFARVSLSSFSTQYRVVVRLTECRSLRSQHNIAWLSDWQLNCYEKGGVLNSAHIPLFHQTTQYRMVVLQIDSLLWKGRGFEVNTPPSIPPNNTVSHGSQIDSFNC